MESLKSLMGLNSYDRESQMRINRAHEKMFPHLERMTLQEYRIFASRIIGHPCVRVMDCNDESYRPDESDFFTARTDFELSPLLGVNGITVYVPENIRIKGELSLRFDDLLGVFGTAGHSEIIRETKNGLRIYPKIATVSLYAYKELGIAFV